MYFLCQYVWAKSGIKRLEMPIHKENATTSQENFCFLEVNSSVSAKGWFPSKDTSHAEVYVILL